jgi:hypothetical protein
VQAKVGRRRTTTSMAPYRHYVGRSLSPSSVETEHFRFTLAIICAIVFIKNSLVGMPSSPRKLWETGMGTLTGNNLLNMDLSVVGGTILANIPQALLSYFYLLFNSILTSMLVGAEWTRFYLSRKPLRVSNPKGQQRSTYWLQVPYKYSLPLTFFSGFLHWSASQSLFLVQIIVMKDVHPRSVDNTRFISTCGYSPIAIILTTIIGCVIVLGGTGLAWCWYPAGIPLAGSCSAVISAACHPAKGDDNAALLPVQWGAEKEVEDNDVVGHCSFTSHEVTQPEVGKLYC